MTRIPIASDRQNFSQYHLQDHVPFSIWLSLFLSLPNTIDRMSEEKELSEGKTRLFRWSEREGVWLAVPQEQQSSTTANAEGLLLQDGQKETYGNSACPAIPKSTRMGRKPLWKDIPCSRCNARMAYAQGLCKACYNSDHRYDNLTVQQYTAKHFPRMA